MDKFIFRLTISIVLYHFATATKAATTVTPTTKPPTTPNPKCDVEQKVRDSLECFTKFINLDSLSGGGGGGGRKLLSLDAGKVEQLREHAFPAKRIYQLLYRHAQENPEPHHIWRKDKRAEARRVYDRITDVKTLTKDMLRHLLASYRIARKQNVVHMNKGPAPHSWIDDLIKELIDDIFNCDFLPLLIPCIKEKFAMCQTEDKLVAEGIILAVMEEFNLTNCYIKLHTDKSMILEEGGAPKMTTFSLYRPPSSICFQLMLDKSDLELILEGLDELLDFDNSTVACENTLFINTSLSNELEDKISEIIPLSPQCRSAQTIPQAVVGNHSHGSDNLCNMKVTATNWNNTRTVPLAAVIDYQKDGEQNIEFNIDLIVEGNSRNTAKVELKVVDKDPSKVSTCRSINDPHITTFDGHYYNNMYEGYFTLYQHSSSKYEVQAIYQKCNSSTNATCNCAVAVRSGDDVFVVDRCRRKCATPTCRQTSRAIAFLNGNLTAGTRIFRKDGGLRYDVILPHGTIVKMITNRGMLNVWIMPSAYDFQQVSGGLCGTFDANVTNDLMFPNGTTYTGPGSEISGQPRPFSQSWRVSSNSSIFEGVPENTGAAESMYYCRCYADLFGNVHSKCSTNMLIESCDLNTDGEVTSNMTYFQKGSETSVNFANYSDHQIDLDEDWEPPVLGWRVGATWNETSAVNFCTKAFGSSKTLKNCSDIFRSYPSATEKTICKEDIKITDDTAWVSSAVEASKQRCMDEIIRNVDLFDRDVAKTNATISGNCINDCSEHGECVNGQCQCDSGYIYGDCSVKQEASTQADFLSSPRRGLCDRRRENCQVAIVFGTAFVESEKLVCFAQKATVIGKEIKDQGGVDRVSALFVSPDQVACVLTSETTVKVKVSNDGKEPQKEALLHTVTDSACYTCQYEGQWACSRRPDGGHCLIGGECYAWNQTSARDDCMLCNPALTDTALSESQETRCISKRKKEADRKRSYDEEMLIKGVLALVLSLAVIVTTIALFIVHRKKQSQESNVVENKTASHFPEKPAMSEQLYPAPSIIPVDQGKTNAGFIVTDERPITPKLSTRPATPTTPRTRAAQNPLLNNPLVRVPASPATPLSTTGGKSETVFGQNILSDSQRSLVQGRERKDSTRDSLFAVVPHGVDASGDTTKL